MLMIENYALCLQPCAGLYWWLRITLCVYNHVQDYIDDWELRFVSTTMCRIILMIENYALCLQPCAGLCWWLRTTPRRHHLVRWIDWRQNRACWRWGWPPLSLQSYSSAPNPSSWWVCWRDPRLGWDGGQELFWTFWHSPPPHPTHPLPSSFLLFASVWCCVPCHVFFSGPLSCSLSWM